MRQEEQRRNTEVNNPRTTVNWKEIGVRNRNLKKDVIPEDKVEWTKN